MTWAHSLFREYSGKGGAGVSARRRAASSEETDGFRSEASGREAQRRVGLRRVRALAADADSSGSDRPHRTRRKKAMTALMIRCGAIGAEDLSIGHADTGRAKGTPVSWYGRCARCRRTGRGGAPQRGAGGCCSAKRARDADSGCRFSAAWQVKTEGKGQEEIEPRG